MPPDPLKARTFGARFPRRLHLIPSLLLQNLLKTLHVDTTGLIQSNKAEQTTLFLVTLLLFLLTGLKSRNKIQVLTQKRVLLMTKSVVSLSQVFVWKRY